jgi:periplasmic divalent cation tolerance protein
VPESYCVILCTVGSRDEAEQLAELLVTRKLAACVQVAAVSTTYSWDGALHKDSEQLLLIKTATRRYDEVETAIRENHSYEVPEIVQMPIDRGLPAYLEWISENTG